MKFLLFDEETCSQSKHHQVLGFDFPKQNPSPFEIRKPLAIVWRSLTELLAETSQSEKLQSHNMNL